MAIKLIFVLLFSFISLFLMRKISRVIGLVDRPNDRKLHSGSIPLVGGISICITISYFLLDNTYLIENTYLFIMSICLLTFIGALDDRFDLSFKTRLIIQALLSISMMYFGNLELHSLGNLFGNGEIKLGWMGYVITIFAVIGAINAFNMVDGIDGLLGGLSIVTFASIALLMNRNNQTHLTYLCIVIIVSMIPYICFNLGLFKHKRKVFMGDAGSMMIGFTVIWILLSASQDSTIKHMRPVTALWLIALPLMDMAAIMIRRILRGNSPFKPDREHLHHIFQRLGLSPAMTLFTICFVASIFSGIGIIGEINNTSEIKMLASFLICFFTYIIVIDNAFTIKGYLVKDKSENVNNY